MSHWRDKYDKEFNPNNYFYNEVNFQRYSNIGSVIITKTITKEKTRYLKLYQRMIVFKFLVEIEHATDIKSV